nr:hypothetical protein [Tanacetum cinerariifolium]
DDVSKQGRIIADMDADVDVTLKDVADIAKEVAADAEIEEKPAELQKVVEVVTTAKLITEVVTTASATIIVAPQLTTAAALTLTTSPSMIVAQQVDESDAEVNVDDVPVAGVADEGIADVNVALTAGRIIADMDADVDVTLKDVADIAKEVAADNMYTDCLTPLLGNSKVVGHFQHQQQLHYHQLELH